MISLIKVDRLTDLLGVAEGVHGDHDTGLTRLGRASKVDSTGAGLGLEIVKAGSRVVPGIVVEASFDVRLVRPSPRGHRYLRNRHALGTPTCAIDHSGLMHIDISLCPSAETDEGSRSSGGGDACSGYTEDQVHSRVEVEKKHNGRGRVGDESHKEENGAVLEEELPEGRTTRSSKETNGRKNENSKIDEHGYKSVVRAR
jgi:hypothetical protein